MPPTTQVIEGSDGLYVLRHCPPQAPPVGQIMVGVHIAPVGQGPLLPTVQGITGAVVGVAMHCPPQAPGFGQIVVGVHVEAVGQGPLLPTVQGMTGGKVCEVMQRPPQVSVWVQVDPVGQGSPSRMQDDAGFEAQTLVVRVSDERMSSLRDRILVETERWRM